MDRGGLQARTVSDATTNAGRHSAACHEAGHAIVAWNFGLQVGAAQAHDDGAGGVKISAADHLPLVDQLAIRLGGHQAQALAGCQIFNLQSLRDHLAVERILSEHGIAEGPEAARLRDDAREKAYGILNLRHDMLINIANELMASGQLSAERMADLLGSPKVAP
jgi:ATP-dependent Zn protease